MDWRKVYINICKNAKLEQKAGKRPSTKGGVGAEYEFHHILPKSLFPLWSDKKSNIVPLTLKEHYFIHMVAFKIWPTPEMASARFRMSTDGRRKVTSREYEASKKAYIPFCKQRVGKNNGMYGKHWFTNGEVNKLSDICPYGFQPGKVSKLKPKKGSQKWLKKNVPVKKSLYKCIETGEINIPIGWKTLTGISASMIKQCDTKGWAYKGLHFVRIQSFESRKKQYLNMS